MEKKQTMQPSMQQLHTRECREEGSLLLELSISVAVLTIGALGFMYAFKSNFSANRDIISNDLETAAVTNAMETLRDADFTTLYSTYQNTTLSTYITTGSSDPYITTLEELKDASGTQANITIAFFVNETNLPGEFGPIADLDGDGVLATADCSATYRMLPTRLTISYETATGPTTRQVFLILGSDT